MAFNLNKSEDRPKTIDLVKKKPVATAQPAQIIPAPRKKKIPFFFIISAALLLASGTWYFMRNSANKKEKAGNQLVLPQTQTPVVKNESQPTEPAKGAESVTQPTPARPVISAGFSSGSAEPVVADATVNNIRNFLSTHPDAIITIAGYASSEGDLEFNQRLSQKRADAFRDYLVGAGIPANRLTAQGKGIANPAASNDTPEGREKNRRVEVEF